MTVETAEKVSKLLEEKIKYESDLSRLLSKDYDLKVCVEMKMSLSMYPATLNINKDKGFNAEVKVLVMQKIRQEIDRVEKEIRELDC